ncbi:hypothetical protein [Singulisphaera sp. PoT]|uniref:hypothetical protein n=1 Tax=Singulisphaera sp. PoT TaxID=3411797 RepID=UPI003BF5BD76
MAIGKSKNQVMNVEEARATCDAIRRGLEDLRYLALDLHDREGWKALGYASWSECASGEFGLSRRHINRMIMAALIEREVEPRRKAPCIPESQLRPLAAIPSDERAEVWQEAQATAPQGKLTARHVREVVERVAPRRQVSPPASPPAGTVINGIPSQDPPDVKRARTSGRIPRDAVVEVSEPMPTKPAPKVAATPVEVPAAAHTDTTAESDDDAWLSKLPLSRVLTGRQLKLFRADALVYRRLEGPRKAFSQQAGRAIRGAKAECVYAYFVRRFLALPHPRHWLACPPPEAGGCGALGEVIAIGTCPQCRGRGYRINTRESQI